ncbi:MAG: hypothetical protein EHM36_06270 [Deltaproteobacteria bacterium]|nr:MAG: hypothetical protein EHM36_06270 [Deltaproteobacteria bacterium]
MSRRLLTTIFLSVFILTAIVASWSSPAEAAPVKWRYQTIWAPSITLWRGDKYLSDLINVLAAGELEITYYQGGSLITRSDEMFDAVAKGAVNMGSDWPSYWEGKNTAFGLITSTPVWFTPPDYLLWFWQGG